MQEDGVLDRPMFDYAAARRRLQARHDARQTQRLRLWEQAREDARRIVQLTIDRYQPQAIVQWGSVLQPQHFSEASDIDLAVAGLEFPQFMQLFGEAEELTRFSLDLLRWEEVDPSFQRIILAKGEVLYGEG